MEVLLKICCGDLCSKVVAMATNGLEHDLHFVFFPQFFGIPFGELFSN